MPAPSLLSIRVLSVIRSTSFLSIASRMATSGVKRKSDALASGPEAKKTKANASITSFFGQPKPVSKDLASSDKDIASPKFDKDKWVSTLTPEEKELLDLEIRTLDDSWLAHLKDEIRSESFMKLKRFLKSEMEAKQQIFPPQEDIYSWSRHTPLNTVKVVILGQDPYHNFNQAHGMCFSVRPPTPAPPSLKNIYKLLKKEYPDFQPPPNNGGLLTPWADRGVLLLNTVLTVRAHNANSHQGKGWEKFTAKVIEIVNTKRARGVVFLAWGNPAKKSVTQVNKQKHNVLYSVHPSPLSAERGFFDSQHFTRTNKWLEERYGSGEGIDWNLNVSPSGSAGKKE